MIPPKTRSLNLAIMNTIMMMTSFKYIFKNFCNEFVDIVELVVSGPDLRAHGHGQRRGGYGLCDGALQCCE